MMEILLAGQLGNRGPPAGSVTLHEHGKSLPLSEPGSDLGSSNLSAGWRGWTLEHLKSSASNMFLK